MRRLAAVALLVLAGCGSPTAPSRWYFYSADGPGMTQACLADGGQPFEPSRSALCCTQTDHGPVWVYAPGQTARKGDPATCEGGSR